MYQVLARKYRPRNFSQLVGQNHVAKALSSALQRGRLHHAYLFTGTRGVGKTTIARILAKCLNCETGVTATPCEVCAVCTAVNDGRFIDLIEIDAASRTGVDDTRELLNNVPYAPTQGRYKVYLIDEVHMFSNSSFNALLKTLEEPPEHVKFLFATTDPQKLPITVISRCLQFTLRPLAKDEIYQHLDQVLMSENIPHENEALWQLAESAQGSLRDALSLTDQAIAYGEGQVLSTDVKDMLGLIDKGLVLDLLLNIHQNQREKVAQLLVEMRQQAIDVTHVLEQLISTLHDMAVLQCLGTVVQDQEEFEQRKAQISQLISAQDLQLYYQIALQGHADLALSLTPEQGFEMCVMRLLAFRPLSQNEVLVQPQSQHVSPVDHIQTQQVHAQNKTVPEHIAATIIEPVSAMSSNALIPERQQQVIQDEVDPHYASASEANLGLESSVEPASLAKSAFVEGDRLPEIDTATLILAEDEGAVALDDAMAHAVVEHPNLIADAAAVMMSDDMILMAKDPEIVEAALDTEQTIQQTTDAVLESEPTEESTQNTGVTASIAKDNTPKQHPEQDGSNSGDPRDVLQPEPQVLTGEWTLEKWDYWLRQDTLSPAVKEIAQHGIMQGQIEGESTLTLDESYQRMFEGFVDDVEHALQQVHPQFRLKVNYQAVTQDAPFELQQKRKRLAYQKAQQKLAAHPVVEQLIQDFGAQIEEFNLKP